MAERALVQPSQIGPGGVPLVGEPIGTYATGDAHEGIRASFWDKFWAQTSLNLMDAPVGLPVQVGQDGGFEGAAVRGIRQSYAEFQAARSGSLKIEPEELNKRYPGLPVPFAEPEYPEVAKLKFDHNERVKRLQAWVGAGPTTGLGFDLATGAAVGADPVNLALGWALGVGRAGLGIASSLRTVFAENLVANTIGEVPSIIQRPRENQPGRTASEVATSAVAGALLGTGIHASIDYALHRAVESVKTTPKEIIAKNTEAAVKASESGHRIDVTPTTTAAILRDAGMVRPGVENGYQFRNLQNASEVSYYVPQRPDTGSFMIPEENGGGIVGVDNRAVANNLAGLPESGTPGKLIRAELSSDASLVDSDTPYRDLFPKGFSRDQMEEKLRGMLGDDRKFDAVWKEIRDVWRERGTVGDLYTVFQDAATQRILPHNQIPLNQFKKLLDGVGYDGIRFRGKLGDEAIDNRVLVYNHDKLTPVEELDSTPDAVPQMSLENQKGFSQDAQSLEARRFHDPEMESVIETKSTISDESADVSTADARWKVEEDQAVAYLTERSKEPGNEHLNDAMADIEAEHLEKKHMIEAAKNLIKCAAETAV